jgi:TRAP-type uncharacterized transport system fused permease subunit
VLLIYALFVLHWQPERTAIAAALAAAVTALAFGYQGRRPRLYALLRAFASTGHAVLDILLISAAAGIVIGVLNLTGLSFNLTYALVQIGGDSAIVLLVLAAFVCILLGMGLPTLGVYVLLAALVAPALIDVGVDRFAAHLFVLYFGMMSMITPPVAIAAFAAAGIAEADPMRTGLAAMRFGWLAYVVPFLFVASPALLFVGSPAAIILAVITAVAGIWMISAALVGYFVARLRPASRVLIGCAGLAALVPADAFPGATLTDIAGVLIGAALIAHETVRAKRLAAGA